jgi:hypothetical protein
MEGICWLDTVAPKNNDLGKRIRLIPAILILPASRTLKKSNGPERGGAPATTSIREMERYDSEESRSSLKSTRRTTTRKDLSAKCGKIRAPGSSPLVLELEPISQRRAIVVSLFQKGAKHVATCGRHSGNPSSSNWETQVPKRNMSTLCHISYLLPWPQQQQEVPVLPVDPPFSR